MVVHPDWQALLKAHGLDTMRGVYENSAGRAIASSQGPVPLVRNLSLTGELTN
jgi:hypothetical protein